MKKKLLIIIPILVWLAVAVYGVFFNITYIDEAKYLIKGWLMTTGQVGYYSTPEFFYQHMPGGLLWYGLGQRVFGPSLLIARWQSLIVGCLIMWFSYQLAKQFGSQAKKNILLILSLAPVAILYYSSAVPQSLAVLSLVMAFYWLFKNDYRLATVAFSASFIIRENFLFTLIIYFLFLGIEYKKNIKELLINVALSFFVLGVFFAPGWPNILNILKNFPGVSLLMPIPMAEKAVLQPSWIKESFKLSKYIQAVKEFGEVYFSFLLVGLIALVNGLKRKFLWLKDRKWQLLMIITGFNILAHTWGAFQLSPRSIIPYFAYVFPLIAVMMAKLLPNKVFKLKYYLLFLILGIAGLPLASLFQRPSQGNAIKQLNLSARALKKVVDQKEEIIWLTNPISLYLAGKISYYPLINHTNFYKPSPDTATVKSLGFWNKEMMAEWLKTADLVMVDDNRLSALKANTKTIDVAILMEEKLLSEYKAIATPENVARDDWRFYEPLGR